MQDLQENVMIIPYEELSLSALQGVIEQYVSRDGIDSSHVDLSFDKKIEQVKQNLKAGKAILVFDQITQTCNIISKKDPVLTKVLSKNVMNNKTLS